MRTYSLKKVSPISDSDIKLLQVCELPMILYQCYLISKIFNISFFFKNELYDGRKVQ